jgi:hypothetical protein
MKESMFRVQVLLRFVKKNNPSVVFMFTLAFVGILSMMSAHSIQASSFPSNPSSEQDCDTVLSENAGALYHWYTSRGNWIDRKYEFLTDECWEEYEYQSEDAKSTYDADLQVATAGLLGALAGCERLAAACFAAAVVEPGPALDAMCAGRVAACVSVAWAAWYVAADMALVEFRNAMDTAYRTRDICTDRTDLLLNSMRESHDSDYFNRWSQLQNEYQACVARVME